MSIQPTFRGVVWSLVLVAVLVTGTLSFPRAASRTADPSSGQPPTPSASLTDDQTTTDGTAADASATDGEQPAQVPLPVFRSGINFIRVDTIVTDDDGNHVMDLQPSDFEIYEDDELQEIETFEVITIDPLEDPNARLERTVRNRNDVEREASRPDVRVFVIFFDDYHVRFGNGRRVAIQLTEFLSQNLLPTDLVGLMFPLTPLLDLNLTRDHDLILEQINSWYGRKYDYTPRNFFEEGYANFPTETVELLRNDISMSALRGLMIYLGGIREARKSVLLVGEGFSNYLPPQLRSSNALNIPDSYENPSVGDPFAAENRMEETNEFFRNAGLQMDLRRLFQTANRFNTAIYPLDPRGLATGEFDVSQPNVSTRTSLRALRSTQDTLRTLAEQTDGRALVNINNIDEGLGQMLQDSSAYYLIGYTSSGSPTDGEFHEIDVRVTRDDMNVRHRRGYWAASERDVERVLRGPEADVPPKAVDVALGSLAAPRRGRLVSTWIGTSRGENGKTKVTFAWEPTAGRSSRQQGAERVLVTAMGDAGGAFYRGRVPERAAAAGRGVGRRGSPGLTTRVVEFATFDADPGLMHFTLAVEGSGGEVLDRDRDEIEIPDFTGPDLVFSTPAFVRARNNLEWQELVDKWDAAPTPARDFRRTERLLVRFDMYAPGTVAPELEAWLLNRRGDRLYPFSVQPAADGHPNQIDVQLASLAPGEYVIELTAATSRDDRTELVAFRLGS